MTNAQRRPGWWRIRPGDCGVGVAPVRLTFTLLMGLVLSLVAAQPGGAVAQVPAGSRVWRVERVDLARLSKTDLRVLESPSLVIDAQQRPHLIYSEYDETGPSYRLNYATKANGGWITRTIALDGGASPALAITKIGQLRAAYLDIFETQNIVNFSSSTDGVNWMPSGITQTAGFNSLRSTADLALDPTDQAQIVYGSQESISGNVYRMALATQSSGTWTVSPIADGNGIAPAVAVDAQVRSHVTYLGVPGPSRWVVDYAMRANGIWITETVGDVDNTPVPVPSRIVVDAGNTPHIVYSNRSRNELVYASRTGPGAWTHQIITGSVDAVDVALDAAGRPHVAYIEPTTPHRLVYATQPTAGGAWISTTVRADSKDDPVPPVSIALGPTGLPAIAYVDFGTGDVRLARLTDVLFMPVVLDETT